MNQNNNLVRADAPHDANAELSTSLNKALQASSTANDVIQLVTALTQLPLKALGAVIDNPATAGSEFVGIVGRLAQSAVRGSFAEDILDDLKKLKQSGDLLDDRLSDVTTDSVTELLDFIDSVKTKDTERLKAVRRLFVRGLRKSTSEQERLLCRDLLIISKKLSGGRRPGPAGLQ